MKDSVVLKDFSKGHGAKEAWRLLAGEGIVSVVADKGLEEKNKIKCFRMIDSTSNLKPQTVKVTCWSKTVPFPQKKLYLAVLVTIPSLSWIGRQMWKI